jgi:hypothetical protein
MSAALHLWNGGLPLIAVRRDRVIHALTSLGT